jgi:hypothetical protein
MIKIKMILLFLLCLILAPFAFSEMPFSYQDDLNKLLSKLQPGCSTEDITNNKTEDKSCTKLLARQLFESTAPEEFQCGEKEVEKFKIFSPGEYERFEYKFDYRTKLSELMTSKSTKPGNSGCNFKFKNKALDELGIPCDILGEKIWKKFKRTGSQLSKLNLAEKDAFEHFKIPKKAFDLCCMKGIQKGKSFCEQEMTKLINEKAKKGSNGPLTWRDM